MRKLSATEAARRFSELLDAVEETGETVVIERRGRAIAAISPAPATSGRALKELLRHHQPDPSWPTELAELRALLTTEDRRWSA